MESDRMLSPEISRTTMSVREMGEMLGLKKTDSYWLLHKGSFKTYMVNGTTRIDRADFERWYAGQVKYHKVDGTPPGAQLKEESYSIRDIAEIFGLSECFAYELMAKENLETITVDYWKRIPREAFERWYASQSRYRTAEDRERDREAEENSIWLPDLARMLGISRNAVYTLMKSKSGKGIFEILVIGGRKRVTRASFDRWYEGQTKYHLLTQEEVVATQEEKEREQRDKRLSRLSGKARQQFLHDPKNPKFYTMDEIMTFYGIPRSTVRYWIKNGSIPGVMVGRSWRIPKDEFDDWLDYRNC